ncbi:MAG: T9SS type A sorting domain-containing protein, partial [Bacteroidota bacterium]
DERIPAGSKVEIFNLQGIKVGEFEMEQGRNILSLMHLAKGYYQIRLKTADNYYKGSLILR